MHPSVTRELAEERIRELRRTARETIPPDTALRRTPPAPAPAAAALQPASPEARRPAPSWLVWAALWVVYLVWGSTYLAIAVVVETMPPLLSAGVRFLAAGAVMFLVLLAIRGPARMGIGRREVGASALIGGLLLLGGNALVMVAEQDVPSSIAALVIASVPLWVVAIRRLARERVGAWTAGGVGVGFTGVALLVLPGWSAGAARGGTLLLVLASAVWAYGSFISRRLPLPKDVFVSTALQMLLGGAIITVAGVASGELAGLDVGAFSAASLGGLAYLVVVGSLLAFTAYTWLLQNAPISKVSTYAYVNPVVAVFLGWLVLSERITPMVLVGAGVIVASVAFVLRRQVSPEPGSEERSDT